MQHAVLNKSWKLHPTNQRLYGHLPPMLQTIDECRTIDAVHCWRSKNELISDVLRWTSTHGRASVGRPAKTYVRGDAGGALGVMVIVVENGPSDTSSKSWIMMFAFHIALILLGKV